MAKFEIVPFGLGTYADPKGNTTPKVIEVLQITLSLVKFNGRVVGIRVEPANEIGRFWCAGLPSGLTLGGMTANMAVHGLRAATIVIIENELVRCGRLSWLIPAQDYQSFKEAMRDLYVYENSDPYHLEPLEKSGDKNLLNGFTIVNADIMKQCS